MVHISGAGTAGILQASQATAQQKKSATSKKPKGKDRVQVSDANTLRKMAHTMMADMPEVRFERIEEIRDALEQGSFKFNSQKVASQIVRNAMSEHVWE
ncbi:MAG: flagellar biosynthesis anti-sigma factor FlgM [Mariprofundaceae bacterium]